MQYLLWVELNMTDDKRTAHVPTLQCREDKRWCQEKTAKALHVRCPFKISGYFLLGRSTNDTFALFVCN